jgi:hypothetical protein
MKPLRGRRSVLRQLECSMLCVKTCAWPRRATTGVGSSSVYGKSSGDGMCSG